VTWPARDTLTVLDLHCRGLRLTLAYSRVPRRPILALVLQRCPAARGRGRGLRLWHWGAESGH
jgi:hypothetical protein